MSSGKAFGAFGKCFVIGSLAWGAFYAFLVWGAYDARVVGAQLFMAMAGGLVTGALNVWRIRFEGR